MGKMKEIIIMQPGPLHLFWTIGVYYFWQLKDRYDFVFIVSENYRDNEQFMKLAALDSIRHIEYMSDKGIWRKHFNYHRKLKKNLQMYSPTYFLMHNRSYVENQYLLYWAHRICPNAIRYYYQNGRMSLRWKDDFSARKAEKVKILAEKYPRLLKHLGLAGELVEMHNSFAFFLNLKVLPLLVCRTLFRPPVNVFTGHIDRQATYEQSNTNRDHLLAYLDNEIAAYRTQGIKNILQIRHPLTESAMDVFKFLYGDFRESNIILILPSYGFTSRMIESGWQRDDLVNHVAGKWCVALEKFSKNFPGFELRMKLHPGAVKDPLWRDIIKEILLHVQNLQIIAASESAEWYVVQSRVIVGDVTSVLWWAGMLGGKIVISLDIFGYPGGGELEFYKGLLHYVDNLEEIPTGPLSEDIKKHPQDLQHLFPNRG